MKKNVYRVELSNGNTCHIIAGNSAEAIDTAAKVFTEVVSLKRIFKNGKEGKEMCQGMRTKLKLRFGV